MIQKYAIKVSKNVAVGIAVGEQFIAEGHMFAGKPAVFVCVDDNHGNGNRAKRRADARKKFKVKR